VSSFDLERCQCVAASGDYFAIGLQHPSITFHKCQEIASHTKDTAKLADALQYGITQNHTRYVSLRGCPEWAVEGALPAALQEVRAQLGPQETEVVVVTGVGGTDDKTNTHKHASHTKGGTVDKAALEALTSGAASKLLATRLVYNFFVDLVSKELICREKIETSLSKLFESQIEMLGRRITPLFTVDHKGSRQQDGSQKKYFGSYLIKLRK
jgi:hypothetical protein